MKARVNLLGGKLFEYIPHCLGLLDNGVSNVEIHAFGGNSNQALILAQILSKLNERKSNYTYNVNQYDNVTKLPKLNSIMTTVELDGQNNLMKGETDVNVENLIHDGFIDFSTYQLLFQNALNVNESIKISVETSPKGGEIIDLLEIKLLKEKEGQYELEMLFDNSRTKIDDYSSKRYVKKSQIKDRLCFALYRGGYLLPQNWEEIARKLSSYDDIIVGLDSSLLKDAFISSGLLSILSVIEKREYVQTPNWILFVIPQIVMQKLEKYVRMKDSYGRFTYTGRIGFRALQEIMELRKNIGHQGVSVVSAGSGDALLDVNSLLRSMNNNLMALQKERYVPNRGMTPSNASDSMLIRSQFNTFVDNTSFKKGVYFLTADKASAAIYEASGNDSVYVRRPILKNQKTIQAPQLIPNVDKTIPLGNLLYELAVEYGELYVHLSNDKVVKLECDSKGKSLSSWSRKRLRMSNRDVTELLSIYNGKFDLTKVLEFYEKVKESFEKAD